MVSAKFDRATPVTVLERVGPVEFLTYVVGNFLVEASLRVRELVGARVGNAFGGELEVLFLAVVRRGGHQQKVAREA